MTRLYPQGTPEAIRLDSAMELAQRYAEKCGATRATLNYLSSELETLLPELPGPARRRARQILANAVADVTRIDAAYSQ